ncbi:substrate-binding periplasmic protein [Roseateles cellulosilyticus]|uniref:Transporter substrate-binding domain-containing protein n=1 Tax=Pelomonas cellulosilytica TaxID=2906762 RepID=A0ABS8Y2X8_9BURK|nr:transporter substrate-binding domain-containing protein [Pelomonas sp. P8]MCE4557491.1 transporter substrate-binding domain-containing protein [Pelomonas sp. P8]
MNRRRTLLAASLAWSTGVSAAAPVVRLKTVAEAGAPHKFGPPGAASSGFCLAYMRALTDHDPHLQLDGLDRYLPVLRIERELALGSLDVFFGLLKTPARLERFRFIDQPALYVSRHRAAVRADDHDADAVRNFDDIRALGDDGVVLATRGTAYTSFLLQQSGLKVDDGATDHLQNLRKLLKGRGRFFYQSEGMIRQLIQAEGLQDQVRMLPAVFAAEPLLVAVSPTVQPARLARLTAAMQAIEANGTAARLRASHGFS